MAVDLRDLEILVLCGGPGAERAVSLESGKAVSAALQEAGLRAAARDVSGDPAEIPALGCDAVFVALHGEFGEDGTVQGLLHGLDLPYTGSSASCCALTIDKIESKRRLRDAGVPTPPWAALRPGEDPVQAMAEAGVSLPVVVKPVSRGSSVGTTIVRDASALRPAADLALSFDSQAMIEAFVHGREITAGMLGNEPLPLIELKPARDFYDYEAKYEDDRTGYLCPAPLDTDTTESLLRLGQRVNQVLGVEHLSRVDLMLGAEGPMVLEVNTIPGFTSHSLLPMAARAAGLTFVELCRRIMELACERHANRTANNSARKGST